MINKKEQEAENGDIRDKTKGMSFWRPSIFEYGMIYDSSFKQMDGEIQRDEMSYLYFETICVYEEDYYIEGDN